MRGSERSAQWRPKASSPVRLAPSSYNASSCANVMGGSEPFGAWSPTASATSREVFPGNAASMAFITNCTRIQGTVVARVLSTKMTGSAGTTRDSTLPSRTAPVSHCGPKPAHREARAEHAVDVPSEAPAAGLGFGLDAQKLGLGVGVVRIERDRMAQRAVIHETAGPAVLRLEDQELRFGVARVGRKGGDPHRLTKVGNGARGVGFGQ